MNRKEIPLTYLVLQRSAFINCSNRLFTMPNSSNQKNSFFFFYFFILINSLKQTLVQIFFYFLIFLNVLNQIEFSASLNCLNSVKENNVEKLKLSVFSHLVWLSNILQTFFQRILCCLYLLTELKLNLVQNFSSFLSYHLFQVLW